MGSIYIYIAIMLCAYTIGALPLAVLLTYYSGMPDPRSYGTKNIGATNVGRKSKILGICTLCIDIAKTFLSLYLGVLCGADHYTLLVLWACTILGQTRSVFLHFTGGKGVSCFIAGILFLYPWWFIPLASSSYIAYRFTQHIWIASLTAIVLFLCASCSLQLYPCLVHLFIALLIIYLHKNNIKSYTT